MITRLLILTVLFAVIATGFALADQAKADTPQFENYAVRSVYHGKVASPLLKTTQDRQFKTMLRQGAHGKPNFAGHYIVTIWGCGAGCLMGAVMDAKSGAVYWIPFSVSGWTDTSDDFQPISFRPNSRLIIVTGQRNEQGSSGAHAYIFDGSHFKPVP